MRILINTTTFPTSETDPVPAFVLDQVREFYVVDSSLEIDVLTPHNAYSEPVANIRQSESHQEIRYHYFWPTQFEKLAGRGILPALKENLLRLALIPFFVYFQFRALRHLCKVNKPDLIYAHWFMTPAIISYFVCRRLNIPLVFTTHASDMSVLRKVPFAKKLVARVLDYASHYTAVSNRTANKMKAYFSEQEWQRHYEKKLSIIPMGTHLSTEKLNKTQQTQLLREAGLDASKNYILCMGRLSEKKGFNYLIAAYALLSESLRQEYQLVIAGDGQLMQSLKSQVSNTVKDGEVIFTGYVSGNIKNTLLTNASLFVLPSIIDNSGDSEGLPVAMMEALASSKTVVATNVSGAEEVLTADTGILVEQKSPKELAEALSTMLSLPAKRKTQMEKQARTLAENFEWRGIAAQHLEILKGAVAKK